MKETNFQKEKKCHLERSDQDTDQVTKSPVFSSSSNQSNQSNQPEQTNQVKELERTSLTLIISRTAGGSIWYVSELGAGRSSGVCSYPQGAKIFASTREAWSYIRSSGYKKDKAELLVPIDFPLIQVSPFTSKP